MDRKQTGGFQGWGLGRELDYTKRQKATLRGYRAVLDLVCGRGYSVVFVKFMELCTERLDFKYIIPQ